MLWEITDEIIEQAERDGLDNWDRNLAEARKRLGIESPHQDDDSVPNESKPTCEELTDEQVKEILSDLSLADQSLVDHYRSQGRTDKQIAEIMYYF